LRSAITLQKEQKTMLDAQLGIVFICLSNLNLATPR